MSAKPTERTGPVPMLLELTEFLESVLELTDDAALDLLTNEGEDLVVKAREVLGQVPRKEGSNERDEALPAGPGGDPGSPAAGLLP